MNQGGKGGGKTKNHTQAKAISMGSQNYDQKGKINPSLNSDPVETEAPSLNLDLFPFSAKESKDNELGLCFLVAPALFLDRQTAPGRCLPSHP